MVYKGVLPNGSVVAVKKETLNWSRQALDEFLNEVVLLSGMKHKNLLTLKGCCLHEQQGLRVYEYVDNINVSRSLLDKGPSWQMVSWPVRLKIFLGVAQGLYFLHALAHPKIIHRNMKARTVYLDRNFDPKIGGFGIAFLFPDEQSRISVDQIAGTRGYLAPEYVLSGELSDKVDVYSFGVLCLEIISGRRVIVKTFPPDQIYLRDWAWWLYEEDRLLEVVDPKLHLTDVEVRDVQRVLKMCLMCVQSKAESRPSMARIVSILQGGTEWEGQVKRLGDPQNALLSFASGSSLGSLSDGA